MGTWKSERGHGSDYMADVLGEAFDKIAESHPEFTLNDLADGIEFATRGFLVVEVNPKLTEVIKINEIRCQDLTIPNRGQIASAKERIEARGL